MEMIVGMPSWLFVGYQTTQVFMAGSHVSLVLLSIPVSNIDYAIVNHFVWRRLWVMTQPRILMMIARCIVKLTP